MDHSKKLDFLHKIAKLGTALPEVQHLDAGGAAEGAGYGSVAGPVGAAVGAVVGSGVFDDSAQSNSNQAAGTQAGGPINWINSGLGLTDNYQAKAAPIQEGTNASQINGSYNGVQNGLTQQQQTANTLNPGVSQGANTEAALSGQLARQAAGQGPNPAQAALAQSTGQNVASQAALQAGQRGASSNAGLAARQAAQQGAATQQQAVGQSATLQAQQELAAQQEQANLANTQIQQGTNAVTGVNQTQQNEQNILQGANTSFNNAQVGMQSNINNVNSQTAAANQNMAANTFGGILGGASSVLSALAKGGMVMSHGKGHSVIKMKNGQQMKVAHSGLSKEDAKALKSVKPMAKKMADGGDVDLDDNGDDSVVAFQPTSSDTSSGPNIGSSSSLPADTTNFSQAASGGGGKSSGSSGGGVASLAALLAKGGEVHHYNDPKMMAIGGFIPPQNLAPQTGSGSQSMAAQWMNTPSTPSSGPNVARGVNLPNDTTNLSQSEGSKGNKKTPATTPSTDQISATQGYGSDSQAIAGGSGDQGGAPMTDTEYAAKGGLMKKGGRVPAGKGEKAVVKGDSLKNDKVPTMLSEGEIVIPRHITMSDRAPEKAAAFVAATLAKRKRK